MKRFAWGAAFAAFGCSSVPSEAIDASVSDAALEADASIDALGPVGFYPPEIVAELGSAFDEASPVLARGGLEIYFARTEMVSGFIVNVPYVANRFELAMPFGAPARAAAFGTVSVHDFEMTDDGLEWIYWRGLGQLAASTRPTIDEGWSAPTSIGVDGFSPSISADGLTIYSINLAGQIERRSRQARPLPWGSATIVPLAIGVEIEAIDVSDDDLEMLLSSSDAIYLASRSAPTDLFVSVAPLFIGAYRNARFGAGDSLISLVDASGTNHEIAIAARR